MSGDAMLKGVENFGRVEQSEKSVIMQEFVALGLGMRAANDTTFVMAKYGDVIPRINMHDYLAVDGFPYGYVISRINITALGRAMQAAVRQTVAGFRVEQNSIARNSPCPAAVSTVLQNASDTYTAVNYRFSPKPNTPEYENVPTNPQRQYNVGPFSQTRAGVTDEDGDDLCVGVPANVNGNVHNEDRTCNGGRIVCGEDRVASVRPMNNAIPAWNWEDHASGVFRNPACNRAVSGSWQSLHTKGAAIDFRVGEAPAGRTRRDMMCIMELAAVNVRTQLWIWEGTPDLSSTAYRCNQAPDSAVYHIGSNPDWSPAENQLPH